MSLGIKAIVKVGSKRKPIFGLEKIRRDVGLLEPFFVMAPDPKLLQVKGRKLS